MGCLRRDQSGRTGERPLRKGPRRRKEEGETEETTKKRGSGRDVRVTPPPETDPGRPVTSVSRIMPWTEGRRDLW